MQHIPTDMIRPSLRHLYKIAKPGTFLILMHSRAPVGQGNFKLERLSQKNVVSDVVTKKEFNTALAQLQKDVLPVHFFDTANLHEEIEAIGWRHCWEWTYHVIDNLGIIDQFYDRDKLVNNVLPLRNRLGRDIITLWQRV